ncbi:MAG TPA: hypothetical protein VMR44_08540 [Thermoanaerobaculia bacterium]|nr:hypothetical protein [Thermoanaerobaculia bacterium]
MSAPRHAVEPGNDSRFRPGSWAAPAAIGRVGSLGFAVGLAGAVLLVVGFLLDREQFFRSYLVGHLYWLGIALGSLGLAMVYHLTGGQWGVASRRILEAASRTLPALVVAFVPLVFGLESVYEWAREAAVAGDPILEHKAGYLSTGAWIIRSAVYFAVWMVLAFVLSRWSARQDEAPSPGLILRMRRLAGAGLVLHVLAVTFAAMDWVMSLDPHWYSTIYGVWFLGGHGIAALAFLIVVAAFLGRRPPLAGVLRAVHFHDWGKLLLAFTLLWTYFSVSQLLIIWSGDIPEEVLWYQHRLQGGWQALGLALVLLHFALPFVLLLSRDLKRDARLLVPVAVLLLVMHWVDYFWNAAPVYSPSDFRLHWLDLVAPVALGGLWVWRFVRELERLPLMPIGDPNLEEMLSHEGH